MKKILFTICVLMMASSVSATYSARVHLTTDIVADSVWGIPMADGVRLADSFHTVPGAGNWENGDRVYDTTLSLTTDATDLQCIWKVFYPGNETTFAVDNITTNILADTLRNPQIDTLLLAADSSIFATSALGTWLINNISGGGGGATVAQIIDSFKKLAYDDTGGGSWMAFVILRTSQIYDSTGKIIDSLESIATLAQKTLDSIKAVLDSVRNLANVTTWLDSTSLRQPNVTVTGITVNANTKVYADTVANRVAEDSGIYARSAWDDDIIGVAGRTITIPNNGITSLTIADDAIGASEIATDAIGSSELAANAITSSEIADNAIDAGAIAADAITSSEIGANAIGASELATDAIGSDELAATAGAEIADAVWDEDSVGHGASNKMAYIASQIASTGLTVSAFIDSLKRMPTNDTIAGTWLAYLQSYSKKAIDSLAKIIDSLESQDDWAAKQAEVINIDGWKPSTDPVASVSGAVGSVTGNVGGNVAGSVGSVTESVKVDMSIFNAALDDDSTLLIFLRAAASGGSATITDANIKAIMDSLFNRNPGDTISGKYLAVLFRLVKIIDSIDAKISTAGSTANISAADMGHIVDSFFNRGVSDTIANSYLAKLLRISGISGRGDYTRYIVVIDSAGTDSVIIGTSIWANNLAQNSVPFLGITDPTGKATVQLDAGSWVILFNYPGYMTVMDTIVVAAGGTDTIWTYNSGNGRTTIYGDIMKPNGSPIAYGIAEFQLISEPDTSFLEWNDTILTTRLFYDTADVQGHFSVELYNNSDISDSSYYRVIFKDRTGAYLERQPWYFIVPDSSAAKWVNCTKWR